MFPASRYRISVSDTEDGDGGGSIVCGAISELTAIVAPPSSDGVIGEEGEGVVFASRYSNSGADAVDRDGGGPIICRTVSEFAPAITSPGSDRSVG